MFINDYNVLTLKLLATIVGNYSIVVFYSVKFTHSCLRWNSCFNC